MKIDSKEEFYDTLQNIYSIEEYFEGMHYWVGRIISEPRYDDLLTRLAEDSKEHKERLDELISKIEGFKPEENDKDGFDFEKDLEDEKILDTVLENDHSALYHYSLLKKSVDEELLLKMMNEGDISSYHETLEFLIQEELKHIKMLRSELD